MRNNLAARQPPDPFSDPVPVVVDIGSSTIKVGFAGEDCPRIPDLPAAVGYPRFKPQNPSDAEPCMAGIYKRGYAIGYELTMQEPLLDKQFLCERGVVKDWGVMEKIVPLFFFNDPHVDPATRPLLVTCSAGARAHDVDSMRRFMQDKLHAVEPYVAPQAPLVLLACGLETGVVVDIGDTVGWIVPVVGGKMVEPGIQCCGLGGRDITRYIAARAFGRLPERDRPLPQHALLLAEEIKESLAYVAIDPARAARAAVGQPYTMPDGGILQLGDELFVGPEMLFDPGQGGGAAGPLDMLVRRSIEACPADARPSLFDKVVLAGGTSMLPGLAARLAHELSVKVSVPVEVLAPCPRGQSRQFSAWIGGSMLFSSPALQRYLVQATGI